MKNISKLISLLLLVTLSSCAAWRAEETMKISKFPTEIAKKSKVKASINLILHEVHTGKALDIAKSKETKQASLDLIKKAYNESGVFEIVDQDSPSKQISIEISLVKKVESSLTRDFLTAVTLYLVPKRTSEYYTVNTKFIDKTGVLIGMVEKKETVVMWHQLFMAFALPFNYPSTTKSETLIDLNRASIMDAYTDGLFVELEN